MLSPNYATLRRHVANPMLLFFVLFTGFSFVVDGHDEAVSHTADPMRSGSFHVENLLRPVLRTALKTEPVDWTVQRDGDMRPDSLISDPDGQYNSETSILVDTLRIQATTDALVGRRRRSIPAGNLRGQELLPIEIQGNSNWGEGRPATFSVWLPDRPLREDGDGYSPTVTADRGGVLPAFWEPPVEVIWDFGDGSDPVSTGEHLSASHRYKDDGTFTMHVTAKALGRVYAEGFKEITVENRKQTEHRMAVIEVDSETSTLEFTATAQDAEGDELLFTWDFGDGNTAEGVDLWKVQHQYLVPGRYQAKLTIDDGEGGTSLEEETVTVRGAEGSSGSQPGNLGGQPDTGEEVVINEFIGTTSGPLSAAIDAEVRSFRGIFLSRISSGACRFTFSAWDDANLAFAIAVLDMHGLPPDGARYLFERPNISLIFAPTSDDYVLTKQTWFTSMGMNGMGALVDGIASILTEEQRRVVADIVGVDPQARVPREPRPMPPVSPFGIEERATYAPESGSFEMTFIPGIRAGGLVNAVLKPSDEKGPLGPDRLHVNLKMSLDLDAARRDGVVRYDGCEPAPLDISSFSPDDETDHDILSSRRYARVRFDHDYDPATLNERTYHMAYRNPAGRFVPVDGRIIRDNRAAWFVPNQPLWPGVRYHVRVKTGEEGVKSFGGGMLEDTEGTGWRSWQFSPRLEFAAGPGNDSNLACHLYQTARDMPLVPGKPAVARVYADWQKISEVHPDDQTREFNTRVIVKDPQGNEVSSVMHKFVRPDLWEARGVRTSKAEHTAQITGFTPVEGQTGRYSIGLEVRTSPSDEPAVRYTALCPTKIWTEKPSLSVDFIAMPFAEWKDNPEALDRMMPTLQAVADESADYMWQLFPVVDIHPRPVRKVAFPAGMFLPPYDPNVCSSSCLIGGNGTDQWEGFDGWLRAQSDADIVIGFVPHGLISGGATGSRLRQGQGTAIILAGESQAYFSRYVNGLVHEVGHILDLDHVPYIWSAEERKRLTDTRDGTQALHYSGIQGVRMSRDGSTIWNKSSTEGNEEGAWLTALMFPATIPSQEAFIANHHYRALQCLFERLAGNLSASCQVTR